jgi:hypothetical protein
MREARLKPADLALAWAAVAMAWVACRWFLAAHFQAPWAGLGTGVLLALLAASAWAIVEEPRLAPQGRSQLAAWLGGAVLLASGQALMYQDYAGKDAAAPLGFALMLGGAVMVAPQGLGRKLAGALVATLLALAFTVWLRRVGVAWDLFQGPWRRQGSITLFWALLTLGVGVLAWHLSLQRLQLGEARPLPKRYEAWALGGILLLGAGLRFWQPAALPAGYWYDEVNLARAIQDSVLQAGRAPLYLTDQVENPGAWLWVGAALFKAFGVSIESLRLASGAFGLLAVLPFWALARLWMGPRWALIAALIFATMRWTLIPQRIAFMSGFALFWMLTAFWALWWAWLQGPSTGSGQALRSSGRWVVAGLALGANLHTYTPARFVPVIVLAFLGLQALPMLRAQGPRLTGRSLAALSLGFLLSAGPMLWYIAQHWEAYVLRSQQVSIFTDVAKSGRPLLAELWGTASKHLLMLNFRGDFNARHNLHFLPHVDFISACALFLAIPVVLSQAWRDTRARFVLLWTLAMLAAGIFTLPVEAPQGHRTILAAPALALALGLGLPFLLAPLKAALGAVWPVSARLLGAALLIGVVLFNGWELLRLWPGSPATYRSFSPRASAVLRQVSASQPGTRVYVSGLKREYQFHGYEWAVFSRFALRQQGRPWAGLTPGIGVPSQSDGGPTRSALLIWGESDDDMTRQVGEHWPGLRLHREPQRHPAPGEPAFLYLSLEVPYERLQPWDGQGTAPLLWRAD